MPTGWTDYPATPTTPIRAINIAELRTAIENARTAYTPPPEGWTAWTDHPITATTRIKAQHFVELKTAIQQLWSKESLGYTSTWTRRGGADPSAGTPVWADDINDLRRWFNLFEAKRYGVYSVVFDPAGNQPRITPSWADDVKKLGVCFVRATMNSRPSDNNMDVLLQTYKDLFNLYRLRGILPIAVFTADTDRPDFVGNPNEGLNAALTNTYIDHFARRAAAIAQFLRGVVDHVEIWNEPDNWAPGTQCPELRSEQFGAMLTWCYRFIKRDPNVNPSAHIISGGLLYHDELQGIGWDRAYLLGGPHGTCEEVGLYNARGVIDFRDRDPGLGTYPWDHLGIHPYHDNRDNMGPALQSTRDEAQTPRGDQSDIWVTEFGQTIGGDKVAQANALDARYNIVLSKAFVGVAIWQKHEWFPKGDLINGWGLTNYGEDPTTHELSINPLTDHFDSWERLRIRAGGTG